MELLSISLPPPPGPLQAERIGAIRSEAAGFKQTVQQTREPSGAVIVTITGNITPEQGVVYSAQGYSGSRANTAANTGPDQPDNAVAVPPAAASTTPTDAVADTAANPGPDAPEGSSPG